MQEYGFGEIGEKRERKGSADGHDESVRAERNDLEADEQNSDAAS